MKRYASVKKTLAAIGIVCALLAACSAAESLEPAQPAEIVTQDYADKITRTPVLPAEIPLESISLPAADYDGEFEVEISSFSSHEPRFNGYLTALAVIPNTANGAAFVAIGTNIYLAGLTDPENVEIGEVVGSVPYGVEQILVDGDRLMVITESDCYKYSCGDVLIFDIDKSFNLTEVSLLQGEYRVMAADGDNFYLVAGTGEIELYRSGERARTPTRLSTISPPHSGERANPEATTTDIAVERGRAYLALEPNHLGIYDVSDESSPELLSLISLDFYEWGNNQVQVIDVRGDVVVIGVQDSRPSIITVDISDPENPELIDIEQLGIGTQYFDYTNLEIIDDKVFYSGWVDDWVSSWTVGVVDISSHEEIKHIGNVAQVDAVGPAVSTGEYVFAPAYQTLETIHVSSLEGHDGQPTGGSVPSALIASMTIGGTPSQIHLWDDHAFVFSRKNVRVFDLTTAGVSQQSSYFPLNGKLPAWIDEDTAYFYSHRSSGNDTETFKRLDLSDPTDLKWGEPLTREWMPEETISVPENCSNVGLSDVCYDTNPEGRGIQFITVKQQGGDWTEYPYVRVPGGVGEAGIDLAVSENLLFAVSSESLFVYSAKEPRAPVLLSELPLRGKSSEEIVEARILYESGRVFVLSDGFWTIDVMNPLEPKALGYYSTEAVEIGVSDDKAVLVDSLGQIEVVQMKLNNLG